MEDQFISNDFVVCLNWDGAGLVDANAKAQDLTECCATAKRLGTVGSSRAGPKAQLEANRHQFEGFARGVQQCPRISTVPARPAVGSTASGRYSVGRKKTPGSAVAMSTVLKIGYSKERMHERSSHCHTVQHQYEKEHRHSMIKSIDKAENSWVDTNDNLHHIPT
jgi:hypothetical protein